MPMKIGTSWNYEVDSFIFSKGITGILVDSQFYHIKEVISDSFTNASGELVYVIDKFERPIGSQLYSLSSVYSALFSNNRFIRIEENNSFIKFPLPPIAGLRWDGNAMVNKGQLIEVGGESIEVFKEWDSRIRRFAHDHYNGISNFKNCFTVQIADYESLIDFRSGYEVYSKNFGLIYRELYVLDTQCDGNPADCKDIGWEQKAEKGFIVKQRLSSFQF